ncbi:SsrA-binding protein SmpB [Patescibacteria group bacterium]|nr:SsrA-binding protein SmpB [Patescibacteria group bacterium]
MPKILAKNKRARFDYHILENFEAGLVLEGQEVKSIRDKNVSLKGSYVTIRNNEAYLINAHISPYKHAGQLTDYDPTRTRKLLLTKKEIKSLIGQLKQKGLTLVPISLYSRKRRIKLEFGLGKGKKDYDKRQDIQKREDTRKILQKLKRSR